MEVALVILDGWGLGDHDRLNAIEAAHTPTFDRYWDTGVTGTLRTDGPTVGLPEGRMGNSEVGHLTIGAGRPLDQPALRIDRQIEAGTFCENEALRTVFDDTREQDGRLHLMGLVSDGGVHADQAHLHALIECAAAEGLEVVIHAFMDGRDTSPTAGEAFITELQSEIERIGTGSVATVTGRYYAMDRDGNWERTKRAYDAIVNREATHEAKSARAAVEQSYDRGDTDEFIEPTLIADGPPLESGDGVVFCNFRADRARQLTRMLADIDPAWPQSTEPPEITLATMTEYDRRFDLPVLIEPNEPEITLGAVLERAGLTQLRIAESEKYPHVTYFLNGGREIEFEGEIREIVASPDVPTYDQKPEMSAAGVTDAAVRIIDEQDPDVLVLNYANPDMVGHTGDYEATIEAVETVDAELDRLGTAIREAGGHLLVTADHGNAEDMGTPETPHTAHTFNPVPFISIDPANGNGRIREGGTLADLAPTILSILGLDRPEGMTGRSLLTN
ncbi:2,3-bisphosphoglycerate-independent phosphoglycerate mutase [Halodesulfurarchaeum formicicum]|uniref:2,3-bisphosphoglycerate-independent phosphoglycerate mutase n=1 Tax=Halodesulfurarchaeum formicicum TaxID=1873524 RepID=A0A1D8S6M0_9EURY|nr:2,3-bisphosphoglycerate-independent phosphoglycerate mutase [Halodesulfurarchaeum formicicum]AOW80995.1 2,3-bisphosphoglycerate-independent phosphoglycerate mutase [Halodesulfurarchaeum formicicum]APE96331.1 2,3-bisphosphoglycerate-independent phosphoglycerate mutase [Halodesulfurarchaeum formicicum]